MGYSRNRPRAPPKPDYLALLARLYSCQASLHTFLVRHPQGYLTPATHEDLLHGSQRLAQYIADLRVYYSPRLTAELVGSLATKVTSALELSDILIRTNTQWRRVVGKVLDEIDAVGTLTGLIDVEPARKVRGQNSRAAPDETGPETDETGWDWESDGYAETALGKLSLTGAMRARENARRIASDGGHRFRPN